jgi:hypothetical protein
MADLFVYNSPCRTARVWYVRSKFSQHYDSRTAWDRDAPEVTIRETECKPGSIETDNDRQTCENPEFDYPGRRMSQKNPIFSFASFIATRQTYARRI